MDEGLTPEVAAAVNLWMDRADFSGMPSPHDRHVNIDVDMDVMVGPPESPTTHGGLAGGLTGGLTEPEAVCASNM